jgi:hypothetical protein
MGLGQTDSKEGRFFIVTSTATKQIVGQSAPLVLGPRKRPSGCPSDHGSRYERGVLRL